MLKFQISDPATTLAYDRAGHSGPRVLLVQGTGCVGEGWRPQIDDLGRDHQVVWFDNRGIGESTPNSGPITAQELGRDCLRLLDHLGWQRAHLVGHSLGGILVQEAARAAPARVQSLSLLSTLRRGRDAAVPTLRSLRISLSLFFGSERSRRLRLAAMPFPPSYLATLSDDDKLRLVKMIFAREFLERAPIMRQQLAALLGHRGADLTPLRSIPTLIVTGKQDIVVKTRFSDELLAHLPQARLERFADAGHGVPIQHAAAVNKLLREHFARAS